MKLECDGVEFGYDSKPLLTSIYLQTSTNMITGLLGRNGSGKSTLMKICFGSIRPWSGSVRIDGRLISFPAFTSGMISYLPQDSFLPVATLRTILKVFKVRADDMYEDFPEFRDFLDLFPSELSGGYLRLFEVIAILHKPGAKFCLLDEPFTGLSPVIVERLQQIIIRKKSEKGIIISDHLYRQVKEISDELIVLANGRTVAVKDHDDLAGLGYVSA